MIPTHLIHLGAGSPEGENPSNFVTEEDDYDGVVLFLVEHDYVSDGLTAARKAQLGI